MSHARILVRMYPESFKNRWGPDLEAEILHAGWRSWPNTVVGIADTWLHPAIWPARSHAQRQLRMTTMAITLTATCWFISHLVTELDAPLSREVGHSQLLSMGTNLMMVGLLLVAPRPRLMAGVTAAVLRGAARRFAVPLTLSAAVAIAAHAGVNATTPALLRSCLLACWWTALALGAVQTCRIATDLGAQLIAPPQPWRLRAGTSILALGSAMTAANVLGFSFTPAADLPATLAGLALLALVPAFTVVLRHTTPDNQIHIPAN
ncbi:MAG: hypothetical protein JWN52_5496 [Actinomycetia bacterium]|nr:hypothetical protein [Actinomycetes bacterium]